MDGAQGSDTGVRYIMVAESPFQPANGGGEQESTGMALALAAAGRLAAVVVPTVRPLNVEPFRELLGDVPIIESPRSMRPTRLLHPTAPFVIASRRAGPGLVPTLSRVAPGAGAVLVAAYKAHGLGATIAAGLRLPAVLRMHNIEGDYHTSVARSARGPKRAVLALEARRVRRDELALGRAPWLQGIADISSKDAGQRRSTATVPVIHVPPFRSVSLPPPRCPDAGSVVFLGALDIATNHDALDWLLGQVWPLVLRQAPDTLLRVVGRRPSAALVNRLAGMAGVELLGDVEDLGPVLSSTALAVNPAVSGSGVNIKLLDYLSAAVPTVTTPLGVAGLDLSPGEGVAVASTAADFAAELCRLLGDHAAAAAMGSSGHRRVSELLSPSAGLQALDSLVAGAQVYPAGTAIDRS